MSQTPQTPSEAIEQAQTPQSVSIAGHTVTQRSIDDLIKADTYKKSSTSAQKKGFGMFFQKIELPGAWE